MKKKNGFHNLINGTWFKYYLLYLPTELRLTFSSEFSKLENEFLLHIFDS